MDMNTISKLIKKATELKRKCDETSIRNGTNYAIYSNWIKLDN